LSALARTCRAFQDPALDILWRNQESLVPLLSCIPFDAWDVKKSSNYPHSIHENKMVRVSVTKAHLRYTHTHLASHSSHKTFRLDQSFDLFSPC
ncbi:hypothetical protein DFH09DRAFT_932442, partial [Mycena vulgaris]